MTALFCGALCVLLVAAQFAFAGAPWFHHGSYVALLALLGALAVWRAARAREIALAVAGAAVVCVAGLACALLAPDAQTYAGSPGESVPLTEPAGKLQFPLTAPGTLDIQGDAQYVSLSGRATRIGNARAWTWNYVFAREEQPAAYVTAFDARGGHLTVTQPQNTSFLSPVLLFRTKFSVAGRSLPADSFAVPAVERTVKALLFAGADLEAMRQLRGSARAGVLFAVENRGGAVVPGGIAFARTGSTVAAGGLRLRAEAGTYPRIRVAAIPNVALFAAGVALFAVGCAGGLRSRFRSRTGSVRT